MEDACSICSDLTEYGKRDPLYFGGNIDKGYVQHQSGNDPEIKPN